MIKRDFVLKNIVSTLLLSISLFGFTTATFILKVNVIFYILVTSLTSFFFSIIIKNLKIGLLCVSIAALLSAFLSWIAITLPPRLVGEEFMVSFTSEVFIQFAARIYLLSFPIMVITLIIGSIATEGI